MLARGEQLSLFDDNARFHSTWLHRIDCRTKDSVCGLWGSSDSTISDELLGKLRGTRQQLRE